MNTTLMILLFLSIALNAVLVAFIRSFRRDEKRFRENLDDLRKNSLQRRARFGHGKKTLAELSTELDGLAARFETMIETKRDAQLLDGISREIRTPLVSLTGYLEVLREKKPAAGGNGETLEIVYRKARLMQRMIEEYFELAKLESGEEPLALIPVNLNEIIRETLLSFDQDFLSAAAAPALKLPEESVMAQGNRAAIERALSNLLFNALKHGGGDTITVRLWEDSDLAYVSVTDYGKGIPEAELPHAFDRLHTAAKARGALERGTGLGLAIARQLVIKQNGEISAQSKPGMGTVFTFTLPKV